MAGSMSDYLEVRVLDLTLGAVAFAPPATVYVALYTVAPTDAGGGTEVGTVTWTNYARVAVPNDATNWPAAAAGAKSNGTVISFGTVTATAAVMVVAVGIFDAAAAGNLLYWADLAVSTSIDNNHTPSFPAGSIDVLLT